MKAKTLTILSLVLLLGFSTQAQKVQEKDVIGTWKLVIDIDDELEEEAENADNVLEEVIIKSVSGLVSGIMDNIDIYFEFQKNNEVMITVDAFGEIEEEKGAGSVRLGLADAAVEMAGQGRAGRNAPGARAGGGAVYQQPVPMPSCQGCGL